MVAEIRELTIASAFGGDGCSLSHGLPTLENGWPLRPFRIVSLLEMIDFDAGEFYSLLNGLVAVKQDLEKRGQPELAEIEQQGMSEWADRADLICSKYEIDVSYYTARVRGKVFSPDKSTPSLASVVNELRHCIVRDLRDRKFLFIPTAESKTYNQEELFGSEVKDRFPEANKEIVEAGNCYATGNYTACVFHLMRAVEIGARTMVRDLKVQKYLIDKRGNLIPVELCDWGILISALEKGVDALNVGTRTSLAKRRKFEFYNHALGAFRNFKDAWRNHVSHTRELYLGGQTKDIIDNTRQFMQHLAKRLKE